ncbi:MAG: cytochrome c [Pyrinomonadaceae bacterium]|nr:cytochrome c [Pyrinomonadaceae bacterium]
MQDQPRYEAYEKSEFFADGLASRKPPPNTVPRGYLREDGQLYTGKNAAAGGAASGGNQRNAPNASASQNAANAASGGQQQQQGGAGGNSASGGAQASQSDPLNVDAFPFPVTMEVLVRGKERYNIFCSMCHGATGYGDGMVVRRGYKKPPSYHEDRLRQERVGHFFDVITNGWGSMPNYAPQIPVRDRWAIAAYIRALQASQQGTPTDVPADKRNQLEGGNAEHQGGGEGH